MNAIYPLKHPIPATFEPALRLIASICQQHKITYFIAGATARDIVLHHVFDRPPGRQTRDIDTAVLVSSWNEFRVVFDALIAGGFEKTKQPHRLRHPPSGLPVDVIPFGAIADEQGEIQWPPEHVVTMSVAGFQEARESAVTVALDAETHVQVASTTGLVIMKLFAWLERGAESRRDAGDFFTLLTAYEHLHVDRLWEPDMPGEELDYSPARLGSYLLGCDLQAMISSQTREQLACIQAKRLASLVDAIVRENRIDNSEEVEQLVSDFFTGLSALR